MQPFLQIYSMGALTSVGLSAKETASSTRAGLSGMVKKVWHDSRHEPFVLRRLPDEALYPLAENPADPDKPTDREARLLRLMATVLKNELKPSKNKFPLYLTLPEQDGGTIISPKLFLSRLAAQTEEKFFDLASSQNVFLGRAGGLMAILQAAKDIEKNPHALVLIAGVDTCEDYALLHRLEQEGRLRTGVNADYFEPGEGAGFLLIGGKDAGKWHNLAPIAQIAAPAMGHEAGHIYSAEPYKGEGLAGAVQSLFAAAPPVAPIRDIYCTMNGENHWGKEWGIVRNRNSKQFAGEIRLFHPAQNFGDIGAASGPVLVALAAIGIAKGYRQSPALVYTSSDYGTRAATLVCAPDAPVAPPA